MTLSERINDGNNNFNLFRFAAAAFVFIQHSFDLLSVPVHWSVGSILWTAVPAFIIISGFLVTKSWADSSPLLFLIKRFLRIFPALLCSIVLAAFILGPFLSTLPLGIYFRHPLTFQYLNNIFLYPIYYSLPGVFQNNPYPLTVNGSLWTLPIEVFLYGALALIGITGLLLKRRGLVVVLIVVALVVSEFSFSRQLNSRPLFLFTMPAKELLNLSIYFFIGSLYYLYSDKILLSKALGWTALIALFFSWQYPFGAIASYVLLPYIIIQFAYIKIPGAGFFRKNDVSYGLYIYAFPVQQTAIHLFNDVLEGYALFPLAFCFLLALSYLSWKFVEQPFLRMKRRLVPDRSSKLQSTHASPTPV